MVVTLGQQYNTEVKPTVIMLYTYINRHEGTPAKKQNETFWVQNKIGLYL